MTPKQAQVVSVLAKRSTGIKDDDLYKAVNLEFTELLEILAMLVKYRLLEKKKLQVGTAGTSAYYYKLTEDAVFTATLKKLPKTD